MKNKLFAILGLILAGAPIVWYWQHAALEQKNYLFYILLGVFLFNTIRSIIKETKLEEKIKELSKVED